MRRDSLALSLVIAGTFALAGCAADASDPSQENVDSTQAASTVVARDYEKQIVDVDPTPSIAQRAQYGIDLGQFENVSYIPFGGTLQGSELRRGQDSNLGVDGPK